MTRDSSGRARVAAPSHPDDIARLAEINALANTLGTHTHDDRYYTKTELGASGGSGNTVHADRVNNGVLNLARIPVLPSTKVDFLPQGSGVGTAIWRLRLSSYGTGATFPSAQWSATWDASQGHFDVTGPIGTINYQVLITRSLISGTATRANVAWLGSGTTNTGFRVICRDIDTNNGIEVPQHAYADVLIYRI